MKRLLFVIILLVSMGYSQQVQAQGQAEYSWLVGLKMGIPAGLNVKTMLDGNIVGVEGIFGFDFDNNVNTSFLFEYHGYMTRVNNWYAGLGSTFIYGEDFTMGLDAVVGLEITFENYPLNAALDWKPSYQIQRSGFDFVQFGLGIRYVLF